MLETVIITTRRKTKERTELGFFTKKDYFFGVGAPRSEFVIFIPNTNKIQGYIDGLKFRIDKYKNSTYSFRLRLYEMDPLTGLPGEYLLLQNNIFPVKNFAQTTTLNLKKENIRLPGEGVFVSFQLFDMGENQKIYKNYPLLIGHTDDNPTYWYSRTATGWKREPAFHSSPYRSYYYLPSMSIIVSY